MDVTGAPMAGAQPQAPAQTQESVQPNRPAQPQALTLQAQGEDVRRHVAPRWLGWQVLIPVVLGVLFALGDQIGSNSGTLDLTDRAFYLRLLVCITLFVTLFEGAYHVLVRKSALDRTMRVSRKSPGPVRRVLGFEWRPADVIGAALLVMLCWLPYLVWLFPGTMWYDTSWQVYEYYSSTYDSGSLSDHHPFMLVYLYGAFLELGSRLFGDATIGMFVLIVIQYVAAAVGFALIACYLRRCGARWGACLGVTLFFALFPFFPMMFCSMVKDTLQAVLFVYFGLLFCEVIRTRGAVLEKMWPSIALLLVGLAICVSKKTGVYVVALPLLACALLRLKNGARVLLPAMGGIMLVLMLLVFPRVVMPALDVSAGGKQEMLAVPIQQVAHNVTYSPEDFTEEDAQLLDDFLMIAYDDIPAEFDYTIVDPIKDGALRDDSLIPEFLALWVREGLTDPLGYVEGWLGMEAGWISFDPTLVVKVASGTIANDEFVSQYASWPDSGAGNAMATDAFNLPKSIPGINLLYNQALWATVLPFFCLYVALKTKTSMRWGRWACLLLLSPYLLTMATLFISPVSTNVEAARYLIGMVSVAALFCGVAVLTMRNALAEGLATPQGTETVRL